MSATSSPLCDSIPDLFLNLKQPDQRIAGRAILSSATASLRLEPFSWASLNVYLILSMGFCHLPPWISAIISAMQTDWQAVEWAFETIETFSSELKKA
jgi:hypothetical protein